MKLIITETHRTENPLTKTGCNYVTDGSSKTAGQTRHEETEWAEIKIGRGIENRGPLWESGTRETVTTLYVQRFAAQTRCKFIYGHLHVQFARSDFARLAGLQRFPPPPPPPCPLPPPRIYPRDP